MGFERVLFEDAVDEDFICSICQDVLENPVSACVEGHTHCEQCIKKWQEKGKNCPDCRNKVRAAQVEHNRLTPR